MNPFIDQFKLMQHQQKVNMLKPSARYIYDWIMNQNEHFLLVINGEAGSGKSFLFSIIKECLEIKKNEIC